MSRVLQCNVRAVTGHPLGRTMTSSPAAAASAAGQRHKMIGR